MEEKFSPRRVGILTLGCKVNQYESEAIAEELERRGLIVGTPSEDCCAFVVNTCTVTAEADRKSRQAIRRLHAMNLAAPIVVTGCTAQSHGNEIAAIDGVRAVCGNGAKLACADAVCRLIGGETERIFLPTSLENVPFEPMKLECFPRIRVYIKIEDGCENRCSYCAIPAARGKVRSKAPEDVLAEMRGFINAGVREIVLTGIETASYGRDLGQTDLGDLLTRANEIADGCRIRLGSLDPSLFTKEFVDKIKPLSALAPHFHISLQSGSSRTLAAMRRKYNAEQARAAMQRVREAIPGVMFTTDVIVGFPTETDEDFAETYDFLRNERFLTAHIFPYSARRGTPAADLPSVCSGETVRHRAAALAELEADVRRRLLEEEIASRQVQNVLFETFKNGFACGHTGSFIEVKVPSGKDLRGNIVPVRMQKTDGTFVYGETL